MRRAARADDNQPAIVEALRQCGATVAITSKLGGGYPDLTVGYRGVTFMMELKDGDKSPSERKLTPAEEKFHREWRGGPLHVVNSVREALQVIEGWR